MSDIALSLDDRRRALLARALPLSASPEEAFLSVEVALLLEERKGVIPSGASEGDISRVPERPTLPVNGAALAHDIFDPRAQAVLNRVRKAARSLTAAARKELEAILSLQPSQIGPRLLKFIQTYRVQLARLLTTAQVAALVQGAAEVAKHVPPVPPAGAAVPPPPTLSPFEAQALLKELRALPPMAQSRRLYNLPAAEQQYVRQVLWLESTLPPTGEPPFWKPRSSIEATGGEAEIVFPMIDEAVAILREKNLVDRATFDRLDTAARTKAFAVAGADAQETLAKIQSALAETLQEGPSLEKFREKVLAAVDEGTFLSDAHLETVFRTNIQGALSDGKLQVLQQPYIRSGFPYARYDAIHDDRVRDDHLAVEVHGIGGKNVYRVDDPVFQAFRPPWDFNCRCAWVPATIRQAAAEGVEEAQEWLRTGIEPTPPAFVPWPPFRPPAAFQRAGMPLSVQLSMQSLLALEGEKIDEEPATSILPGGGLQPGLDPGNEPKNTQADRKKGRWKGKGKRRTKRVARLRKPRNYSAILSLEDQLCLIDACFAWVRTGTTNREGKPGWRNPDTGETRYQEIEPGTRQEGAPQQPSAPSKPQQEGVKQQVPQSAHPVGAQQATKQQLQDSGGAVTPPTTPTGPKPGEPGGPPIQMPSLLAPQQSPLPFPVPYKTSIGDAAKNIIARAAELADKAIAEPVLNTYGVNVRLHTVRLNASEALEKAMQRRAAALLKEFRNHYGDDLLKKKPVVRDYAAFLEGAKELVRAASYYPRSLGGKDEESNEKKFQEALLTFRARVLGLAQSAQNAGSGNAPLSLNAMLAVDFPAARNVALSLEDQLELIDACFAWVRTGTTSKDGQPGWRNPDTGETRYQEIQPGTRKPAAPEQPGQPRSPAAPAGKPQPQAAKPPGPVQAKKPRQPRTPRKPKAAPVAAPAPPKRQLDALQLTQLSGLQSAARLDAANPDHVINRFKSQMADFTPPGGGPAIKTVRSTQDNQLTAEDNEQVAVFHARLGGMFKINGQDDLAQSNFEAARVHREAAKAKTGNVRLKSRAHKEATDLFSSGLEDAEELDDADKKAYRVAYEKVLVRMPATAASRVANRLNDVEFFKDSLSLSLHLANTMEPGYKSKYLDRVLNLGILTEGCYTHGLARLWLDGITEQRGRRAQKDVEGTYAHEMAHAIDAGEYNWEHSYSDEWMDAYNTEINVEGDPISKYARTKPSEGWAEFGRLVYSGKVPLKEIEQEMPKASAYWKKQGFWPDVADEREPNPPPLAKPEDWAVPVANPNAPKGWGGV